MRLIDRNHKRRRQQGIHPDNVVRPPIEPNPSEHANGEIQGLVARAQAAAQSVRDGEQAREQRRFAARTGNSVEKDAQRELWGDSASESQLADEEEDLMSSDGDGLDEVMSRDEDASLIDPSDEEGGGSGEWNGAGEEREEKEEREESSVVDVLASAQQSGRDPEEKKRIKQAKEKLRRKRKRERILANPLSRARFLRRKRQKHRECDDASGEEEDTLPTSSEFVSALEDTAALGSEEASSGKGDGMRLTKSRLKTLRRKGVRAERLMQQGIFAGRDFSAAGKGDLLQLHGFFNRGLLPGGITGCAPGPTLLAPSRHARLGHRTERWSTEDVCLWVSRLSARFGRGATSKYVEGFRAFNISGKDLVTLTKDDLKDMRIASREHRQHLLDLITELRHARKGASAAAPSHTPPTPSTPAAASHTSPTITPTPSTPTHLHSQTSLSPSSPTALPAQEGSSSSSEYMGGVGGGGGGRKGGPCRTARRGSAQEGGGARGPCCGCKWHSCSCSCGWRYTGERGGG